MDEHTNPNSENDSGQISQDPPQNEPGNPPKQQNSQEQPQFQQYLNQEQAQNQNPYQKQGQDPQSQSQQQRQDPQGQQEGQYPQGQSPYPQNQYQQPGQPPYPQNPYQQPDQQSYRQSPYQQPYQQLYQQGSYQQAPPKQSNGMALASMIVGIFALLTCCIPFLQFPLAVISIVLVILSKKGRPFHGFAIAGLVMAIISIVVSIGMTFYWGYVIKLMNDPEFMSMYNELMEMYQ